MWMQRITDRAEGVGRVPAGYTRTACPSCAVACLVPDGVPRAHVGCVGCLRLLGAAPLVRHDLAALACDPGEDVRLVPCAPPAALVLAAPA